MIMNQSIVILIPDIFIDHGIRNPLTNLFLGVVQGIFLSTVAIWNLILVHGCYKRTDGCTLLNTILFPGSADRHVLTQNTNGTWVVIHTAFAFVFF